ncbi:EVE domain-containing protein [Schlesneria sp. DSM 10557]|uniref:EVE domain-containing protein n=1 Tax=Schlesneria sp. DSM 10557 TaxID=3044399 RepID=UPI0035A1CD3E
MKKDKAAESPRRYWLFKSEPSAFGIEHLAKSPRKTAPWDGVRNYQARNFLRDDVQLGDQVLFYHSREEPLGVFGTMQIVRTSYPDFTAFDPQSKYFDEKGNPENPRWFMVDVKLIQKFPQPVTRDMLAEDDTTSKMLVMKRGMRLSIQPVTREEWEAVHRLAGVSLPD